jgi:hypothetical protein
MRGGTVIPLEPIGRVDQVEDPPAADAESAGTDLHLVAPGRREQADHDQQRRAFGARRAEIAELLARAERFEDRLALYRYGEFTWHELTTAAALYPELMPRLNDEWEWIALTLADNLD